MSSGSRNGRISKYIRQVAEKAGLKNGDSLPYAPDFLDSLVRRMAIPVPGEIAERCLAWLIYRANGSQSLKAIHLYSRNGETPVETELRQHDCALELAWVEAGHRVEWLDAPRDMFQAEANRRGVKPIDKSRVSNGFQFNRIRGTMEASTGHSLVYVPSPNAENFLDVQEICRTKGETPTDNKEFRAWAQVAYVREFQEWEVVHAEEKRLMKFLLAAYKKSKSLPPSKTNGTPSLEALEALETLEAPPPSSSAFVAVSSSSTPKELKNTEPAAAAAVSKLRPAAAVFPSPIAEPPATPPPVPIATVVAQELEIDDDAAQRLVTGCKAVEPAITAPEIVELARTKLHKVREQVRKGKITSVVGLLISHVPQMCKGAPLQAVREQIEAERQDRALRVEHARAALPELSEEERVDVLRKYPELAVPI